MKQKFDANAAIKGIRWMTIGSTSVFFVYNAAGLLLLTDASSKGNHAPDYILELMIILGLMAPFIVLSQSAMHGVYRVFQSQQSEIADLKAAIERLQGGDDSADYVTAPLIEGMTTT